MASGKGLCLKLVQWFIRGIQFGCAALVLGVNSYFLATLANHDLDISNHIRAVEGISGIATLYTILGLVLLCCLAGYPFTSFIAVVLDIAFSGSFAYVAWVNRGGAGTCEGYVDTPYGEGSSDSDVEGSEGFTDLPNYRQACRLQTACFSVAIVAVFFFLFSALVEVFLARHRKKERRFGPSPQNNYTSGSGGKAAAGGATLGGLLGWRGRKKADANAQDPENNLPEHTTPADVRNSYNTEATAVGPQELGTGPNDSNKYGESGYGYSNGYTNGYANGDAVGNAATTDGYGGYGPTAATQQGYSNPYRYDDGVYNRP